MRIAFLVPDPDYPEPWRWAFDVEAAALIAAGVDVVALAWTEASDFSGFDLVLPLVAWGYHLRYPDWLAFLERAGTLLQSGLPSLVRLSMTQRGPHQATQQPQRLGVSVC